MDIDKVLAELRAELARINDAIVTLERLQQGVPRRGRPPGWLRKVTQQPERPAPKLKRKAPASER